jgi:hypothetical protein
VEGWVLPDDSARPPNTKQYKDRALQTTWRQADGYQWIRLASPPDATHLQFVLNDVAHGAWYEASDRESWSVPLMPSADARTAPVADTPPPPPPMLQPQPEQQAQRVEAEVAPAAPVAPMPPPAPVYTEGGYAPMSVSGRLSWIDSQRRLGTLEGDLAPWRSSGTGALLRQARLTLRDVGGCDDDVGTSGASAT